LAGSFIRGQGVVSQERRHQGRLLIDASVEQSDTLLAGLDPSIAPVTVAGNEDPSTALQTLLADPSVTELHVLGHGRPGGVRIGSRWLTPEDFRVDAETATTRCEPLEILFWSCHTGADAAGRTFMQDVAEHSMANVFASTDLIGDKDQGGSWELNASATPRAAVPFSQEARDAFGVVLAINNFSLNSASTGVDVRTATYLQDGTGVRLAAGTPTVDSSDTIKSVTIGFDGKSISSGTEIVVQDKDGSDVAIGLDSDNLGTFELTGSRTISFDVSGTGSDSATLVFTDDSDETLSDADVVKLLESAEFRTDTDEGDLDLDVSVSDGSNTETDTVSLLPATSGDDTFSGGSGDDTFSGGSGDDTFNGGGGADTLTGGSGDDAFLLDAGDSTSSAADELGDFGVGNDRLVLRGDVQTDGSLNLSDGTGFASGAIADSGDEIFVDSGDFAVTNATGGDITFGETNVQLGDAHLAFTNSGDTTGGDFDDYITGTTGAQTITGGSGDDTITGAGGSDDLSGGAGNDTFLFSDGAELDGRNRRRHDSVYIGERLGG
jgi:hypothetical protein